MSSQRVRTPVARASLGARRAGAAARNPRTPIPVSRPEAPPAEAVSDPAAAPNLPDEPELPLLLRLVPVLTPARAPRAARPFVVSAPASAVSASTSTLSLRALLAAPAFRVACASLGHYARSAWLLVDLVGIAVIWAIRFRSTVTPPSFFEAADPGLALLSILGAYGILQAMPPQVYLRLVPRHDYRAALAGIVLANAVVRAACALVLLLLTLVFRDLIFAIGPAVLAGMLGLVASCVLIGTVSLVLALPVVGRIWREGALVLVLLALYSYVVSGPLGQVLSVTRVLLLPIAACYNLGQTGELDWPGLLALLVVAALVAGMVYLGAGALTRRHAALGLWRLPAFTPPAARDPRIP